MYSLEQLPIDQKVRIIAQECDVTGNRAAVLKDFYTLPQNVTGLSILDVCAGESDWTAYLNDRGANAVALDYSYDSLDILHQRRLRTYRRGLQNEGSSANRHLNFANTTDGSITGVPHSEFREPELWESTQRFKEDIVKNPQRYKQGSALALPFDDNTFDRVYSFFGIVGVFEDDMKLLRKAADEAIRVIKPGGQIQIGPAAKGTQTSQGRVNTSQLVTELMQQKDRISVATDFFDFRGSPAERITVTKK